jgi:glutaminyl-tRNA synthetase
MSAPASSSLADRFKAAGLNAKEAESAAKAKSAKLLDELLTEANTGNNPAQTNLLYTLANKYPAGCSLAARKAIVTAIVNKGIKSTAQLDAAIKYAKLPKNEATNPEPWNEAEFEKAAGIGVVVTPEQINE